MNKLFIVIGVLSIVVAIIYGRRTPKKSEENDRSPALPGIASEPQATPSTEELAAARYTAGVELHSLRKSQADALPVVTASQIAEHRIIIEQLRIARTELEYFELLRANPDHPNATRDGEKQWALTGAELQLQFAGKRIDGYAAI